MHHGLKALPQISSELKEAHFWNNGNQARTSWPTLGGYMRLFQRKSYVTSQTLFEDSTPRYMYSTITDVKSHYGPSIAQNMAKILPKTTKYIVMLRDPVSRLQSDFAFFYKGPEGETNTTQVFHELLKAAMVNYKHCTVNGLLYTNGYLTKQCTVLNATITAAQEAACRSYKHQGACRAWLVQPETRLAIGTYSVFIKHWLQFHARDQFLFLRLEDFSAAPAQTLVNTIVPFLGIKPSALEIKALHNIRHKNRAKTTFEMLPETRQMLETFYQPYNKELSELLQDSKYLWLKP